MKAFLLLIASFAILSFTNVKAQCTVSNVGVKLNSSVPQGGGGCLINIDLSFDLTHNSGNKWVNIHIWRTSSYANFDYSKAPKAADLSTAVANIVIDQRAAPTAALFNGYPTDNGVTVQYAGLTLTRIEGAAFDKYIITGISLLTTSGCDIAQSFTADVWSSQANPDNVVHCVNTGLTFIANDPKAIGSILCQAPRKYSVVISTISSSVSGTYKIYRDNGDGILDPLVDAEVATDIPWSATNVTAYQSGPKTYAGNTTSPESNQALFAVVTTVGLSNTIITRMDNGCGPLPVTLSEFSTSRKNSIVSLNWKTSTETNVRRFDIEKKTINGFVTIGSVNALNITNGSAYSFIDNNSSATYTEYRIKTIDNSGSFRYSDIRVVKGLGELLDFSLYPNPSNGATKIVLTDIPSLSTINITDITGKIVKTYTNLNTNYLDIKGLQKGVYFVKLTDQHNVRVMATKKIVVN